MGLFLSWFQGLNQRPCMCDANSVPLNLTPSTEWAGT